MTALKIEDIRAFTSALFVGGTFDRFLVREVTIVTFNTFKIDGHTRQGYYTEEELEQEQIEEFSSWLKIKPICFSLIKGKKQPGSFHITLQLPPDQTEQFLAGSRLPIPAEQVSGLYLNIRFEEAVVHCITGTSVNVFTMDKNLDREWDEAIRRFFKKAQVIFQEG